MPKFETKADLVQEIYGNELTIDYALPLDWVRQWGTDQRGVLTGFNPIPHFVWAYPKGFIFGFPAPLTIEGLRAVVEKGYPYHEPPYNSSIAIEFDGRSD
tara:strand:+ start:548 stop:847 length:300 start_codon:yes stop_codon:yes gene_type:complete